MNKNAPTWALRTATPEDQVVVKEAHRQGRVQIKCPNGKGLRTWAKQQGWPTPLFGFEEAFIVKMLESKESFALAIKESGIEIYIPRRDYTVTGEMVRKLDALYEERSSTGQPTGWGMLVEELRQIRRAVEAGVVVNIEGEQTLLSWQDFYQWAHGRYHMLEDGYDKWIGDDS